jgi:hypothetical protein
MTLVKGSPLKDKERAGGLVSSFHARVKGFFIFRCCLLSFKIERRGRMALSIVRFSHRRDIFSMFPCQYLTDISEAFFTTFNYSKCLR